MRHFLNEKAPKKIFSEMSAMGGGGGRVRERKINAITNQRLLRLTHG